ncbi:SCL-interrupting locus protein homolog isoform X2 [Entelurus aequoreus]|uniref:SCL-interrupting locus protein homolog isoform X2 n=1 Tax=Entelurus aequoreus TaxID=161455 RepID=UPI002B1DBEE3|nr:SCL-interrupting locus protein homolog isoform X2 [Entelurus aequoreus]XP_061894863.1 SCL-interrupting locus protein homolog isoform X2 [Entelurus aequoreus]XP_061894864.1 SCL-interrupting locus protein homolog isoform X2 [Entelurus aequoreus]
MSCPVNLRDLPAGVFQQVFSPENVSVRPAGTPLTSLSFPKSRSALWDGSPVGEKLCLQLCSPRMPRLLLREKALRLAQRHARRCKKSHVPFFFLGSVSVDADEEGVTVNLDRFDPGRDQPGTSDRVPTVLIPGDVLVPCVFSSQKTCDDNVQSEAELYSSSSDLQRYVSGRQTLDLSQLIKVKGRINCQLLADTALFDLSWSYVCPSTCLDVQPVRAIPVIPTALHRSLTSLGRVPPTNHQRGFLTMDKTRKLVLVLESDPKASKMPLVGLWMSGVIHVCNPQVWAWCLRFLFSSALQDRVLSENGSFLLAIFGSTHRAPQFFQCRGSDSGSDSGQMDCRLLSATEAVTLYQEVKPADQQTLHFNLSPEGRVRRMQALRHAQGSFSSGAPPPAVLSISNHDSGVEDDDGSPRPSRSPHFPAQQILHVQPSVPELSLLIENSFISNHNLQQDTDWSPHNQPPPSENAPSSAPPAHLHSTPIADLPRPCTCCPAHAHECTPVVPSVFHGPTQTSAPSSLHPAPFPLPDSAEKSGTCPLSCSAVLPVPVPENPPFPNPASPTLLACQCSKGPQAGGISLDVYVQQLYILQAKVEKLLENQGDPPAPKTVTSIAVETGASLYWGDQTPPTPISEPHAPAGIIEDTALIDREERSWLFKEDIMPVMLQRFSPDSPMFDNNRSMETWNYLTKVRRQTKRGRAQPPTQSQLFREEDAIQNAASELQLQRGQGKHRCSQASGERARPGPTHTATQQHVRGHPEFLDQSPEKDVCELPLRRRQTGRGRAQPPTLSQLFTEVRSKMQLLNANNEDKENTAARKPVGNVLDLDQLSQLPNFL